MSRYSGAPPTKATIDALGADATTLAGVAGAGYMQQSIDGNGYPALVGGGSGGWARTTAAGILPYAAGGSGVGTPSWPFAQMYSSAFYEGGVLISDKYAQLNQANTFTVQQQFGNANSFVRNGGDGDLILGATNEIYLQRGASYYPVTSDYNFYSKLIGNTALISVGEVGSYAFMRRTAFGTCVPGQTVPASELQYADNGGGATGSAFGTWRCMGFIQASGYVSLFLRIA